MRVPIVEYPEIVRRDLPQFEPIFANENQVKHFCEYVIGLIAGDKATAGCSLSWSGCIRDRSVRVLGI